VQLSENEAKKLTLKMGLHGSYDTVDLSSLIDSLQQDLELDYKTIELDYPHIDLSSLDLNVKNNIDSDNDNDNDNEKDDYISNIENIKSITNQGDIWLLNKHKILCGDSTKEKDVNLLMDGNKAEIILSDPPYGINKSDIINDNIKNIDRIYKSIVDTFNNYINNNGVCYIFGVYPIINLLHDLMIKNNFKFIQDLYFLKTYSRPIPKKYINTIEIILFFAKNEEYIFNNYKKDWTKFKWLMSDITIELRLECERDPIKYRKRFNMDKEEINYYENKEKELPNIFKYSTQAGFSKSSKGELLDRDLNKYKHPTRKPIELLTDIIFQSTNENDIIYDGFLGSGSTLIAAEKTNRICYGMEIDNHYCDVIVKRYIDFVNGDISNIKLIRDNKTYNYSEIAGD